MKFGDRLTIDAILDQFVVQVVFFVLGAEPFLLFSGDRGEIFTDEKNSEKGERGEERPTNRVLTSFSSELNIRPTVR